MPYAFKKRIVRSTFSLQRAITLLLKKFRQWQMAADGIDAYNDEEVEGGHEQMYV